MKRTIFRFALTAFLIFSILIFAGCPEEGEDDIDPALVGDWSNKQSGDDLKTFTIYSDGSFTADLTAYTVHGTVTGILYREGSNYKMNKMKETTSASWGSAVGGVNNVAIQIALYFNTYFELKCKSTPIVETFFGGTYYKQP